MFGHDKARALCAEADAVAPSSCRAGMRGWRYG